MASFKKTYRFLLNAKDLFLNSIENNFVKQEVENLKRIKSISLLGAILNTILTTFLLATIIFILVIKSKQNHLEIILGWFMFAFFIFCFLLTNSLLLFFNFKFLNKINNNIVNSIQGILSSYKTKLTILLLLAIPFPFVMFYVIYFVTKSRVDFFENKIIKLNVESKVIKNNILPD